MSDAEPKTTVSVEIAGEVYTVRSAASADHVRRCAEYVDRILSEHVRRGSPVELHKAVILAALSLADQYFRERDQARSLRAELADRAARLAAEIEADRSAPDLASQP